MDREMDLQQIFSIIRKKWLFILLSTGLAGLLAFAISSFVMAPQYSATASMYVYNSSARDNDITTSDLTTSQKLVQTYIVILKSNSVLNNVSERLGGAYTADEIRGMLSAEGIDETEAFSVTITSDDPVTAQKIANTITEVAPDEIIRVVKAGAVEVIDYAEVPQAPSSPNVAKNTAAGVLAGLVLGVLIAVIIAMFDTVIHSEEDLAAFDIPIIGVIPNINKNEHGRIYRYVSKE